MIVQTLYESLDSRFPFAAAGTWDRVGLQIGDWAAEIGDLAVVHEITDAAVDQMLEAGISTVVTYHPLLFVPTTELILGPSSRGRALRLANAGVAVISVHTAFDVARPGTGDALLTALGLTTAGSFAPVDDEGGSDIGRIGTLNEPVTVGQLRALIETVTGSPTRSAGSDDRVVSSIGVVPGSGGSFLDEATAVLDVVVTGDISHHEASNAASSGLAVIDAGHIPSERPGVEALYSQVCTVVPDAVRIADNPNPWED